jgi:putative ABC transport system permease protein
MVGLRSVWARPGTASMIIIGIAAAVAVVLSILTLSQSLDRAITGASRLDRAIVLSQGSALEWQSVIRRPALVPIAYTPGVRKDTRGEPIASVELLGRVRLRERREDVRSIAVVRGVSPGSFALRPEIKLLEGRLMTPGLHELLVGRAIQGRYQGLSVGDTVTIRESPWTVVGSFSAAGSTRESEILADTETLAAAYKKSAFQSVWVQMDSAATLAALEARFANDKTLKVEITNESEYNQRESAETTRLFRAIAYLVGIVMGAAATFGAATMMYSAVQDRLREIGTLRALGFSPSAVAVSVLAEVSLLALIGAGVGVELVALILNGVAFSSANITIDLHLSTALALIGVAYACLIGLISGSFAAVQAARAPIATALRAI